MALGGPLARRVHQVQHLHQLLPGFGGDRPLSRPQVCRAAGAALSRERPAAVARRLGRLLLRLPRLQRGLPHRRQDRRDQRPRPRRDCRRSAAFRCATACSGATSCWAASAALRPSLANFALHNSLQPSDGRQGDGRGARCAAADAGARAALSKTGFSATHSQRLRSEKKVVYFHGCATMYYEPFIGMAAVLVLEHHGYEVIVPLSELLRLAPAVERRVQGGTRLSQEQRRLHGQLRPRRLPHHRHQHQLHPHAQGRGPRAAGYGRREHDRTQDGHLGYL